MKKPKPPLKLSKTTYLLILLIEECAEIIHRTCKAIRFGMEEKQPGQPDTNLDRLEAELVDLDSIEKLLQEELLLSKCRGPSTLKIQKVRKYMLYSANECATLDLSN